MDSPPRSLQNGENMKKLLDQGVLSQDEFEMTSRWLPAGDLLALLGGIAGSVYCLSSMVAQTTAPRSGIVIHMLSVESPVFEPLLLVSVLLFTIAIVRLFRHAMKES